jgi:GNAT superfamily N-acetyltransferase
MIEIRPMGEDFILPRCLHGGPIEATAAQASDVARFELPPHPWSDETIREVAAKHGGITHGGEPPSREFMREMIQRYGTCALLAWQEKRVVGFLRFYPMRIARLVQAAQPPDDDPEEILDCRLACEPEEDEGTLWLQCVMASRPYTGTGKEVPPTGGGDRIFRTAEEAGGRKGAGLSLAKALVPWAREHGWKRIVKIAHCDLDFFYGIWGGGGRTFWEKAGFRSVGTVHRPHEWSDDDMAIVRAQMAEKGMSEEDVWTYHRMTYEL